MTAIKREERIGGQRLILGDCLEVMPELGRFDAVVTDPPYGIGFKYNNHDDDENEYPEFLKNVIMAATDATSDGGLLFFFQAMKNVGRFHAWFPEGFRLFAAVRNFTQHLPTPVQYSWDPVVWWVHGKSTRRSISGQRDYHIGNTAKWVAQASNGHPCPRPLDTIEYLVKIATDRVQQVLDPFMGSGTTLVACQKLGRRGTGIEIDPDYFEIACRRVDEATRQPDLFIAPPEKPTQEAMDI